MNRLISDAWEQALTGYEYQAESDGLNPRSIANRRSAVTGLARWLEAEHHITDPSDVEKTHLQAAMIRALKERQRSGARTHYNDLRSFWVWWADDTRKPCPMDGIKRPSDVVVPVPVLTSKQIAKILAATSGRDWLSLRDRAIVMALLETGCRRAELCALDVSDVDLKRRELIVRRGKGGRSRVTVFGPETASALHRLLRRHPLGAGPLFTTRGGKRLSACAVGAMLHRRGEQAGVAGLRAHVFRHSWCHYNLASGLSDLDAMQLGGWSSPTQLTRYGAALASERAREAARSKPVLSLVRGR